MGREGCLGETVFAFEFESKGGAWYQAKTT